MIEVNPLLLTGAVIGTITALLTAAYVLVKDKKSQMEMCRRDSDIRTISEQVMQKLFKALAMHYEFSLQGIM